ncbi:hypothetical protein DFH11DRAFT_1740752 [Phellopilus nigrolimitatus]|nr:hypothetical protein DFH11DRAFT_1740752 [Phellopilus nigrolimitatus]
MSSREADPSRAEFETAEYRQVRQTCDTLSGASVFDGYARFGSGSQEIIWARMSAFMPLACTPRNSISLLIKMLQFPGIGDMRLHLLSDGNDFAKGGHGRHHGVGVRNEISRHLVPFSHSQWQKCIVDVARFEDQMLQLQVTLGITRFVLWLDSIAIPGFAFVPRKLAKLGKKLVKPARQYAGGGDDSEGARVQRQTGRLKQKEAYLHDGAYAALFELALSDHALWSSPEMLEIMDANEDGWRKQLSGTRRVRGAAQGLDKVGQQDDLYRSPQENLPHSARTVPAVYRFIRELLADETGPGASQTESVQSVTFPFHRDDKPGTSTSAKLHRRRRNSCPSLAPTHQTTLPYPTDCLVFVKNVHLETNKTTLRSLFTHALGGVASGAADAIDYVDYNKGLDSCLLRLTAPQHARALAISPTAKLPKQAHWMARGKKEEVYWEKVPEKIRKQAVAKAQGVFEDTAVSNGDQGAAGTDTGGKNRKRRKHR